MRIPVVVIPMLACSLLAGCTMFTAWRAIPPPGGCDQCHSVEITANWRLAYQTAHLTDEQGREYFQTAAGTLPVPEKPVSLLDIKKGEDQPCFECHKAPSDQHKKRRGSYHHK